MLALYLKSLTKMGVKWIRELHLKPHREWVANVLLQLRYSKLYS